MNKNLKALCIITLFLHGSSAQALPLERFFTFFNHNYEQVQPYTEYIWPSISVMMASAALYVVVKDYYNKPKKRTPRNAQENYTFETLKVPAQHYDANCGYHALLNALQCYRNQLIQVEGREEQIAKLEPNVIKARKKLTLKEGLLKRFMSHIKDLQAKKEKASATIIDHLGNGTKSDEGSLRKTMENLASGIASGAKDLLKKFMFYLKSPKKKKKETDEGSLRKTMENLASGIASGAIEYLIQEDPRFTAAKDSFPINETTINEILNTDSQYKEKAKEIAEWFKNFSQEISKKSIEEIKVDSDWLHGEEIKELLVQNTEANDRERFTIIDNAERIHELARLLDDVKDAKEKWHKENSIEHFFILGTMEEHQHSDKDNAKSRGHWIMLKACKENGVKKYTLADSLPNESHKKCAQTIINWLEN